MFEKYTICANQVYQSFVISIKFINSFCNRFLCKFNLRKLLAKFLLEGLRFVLEIFEIFVVEIFVVEIF